MNTRARIVLTFALAACFPVVALAQPPGFPPRDGGFPPRDGGLPQDGGFPPPQRQQADPGDLQPRQADRDVQPFEGEFQRRDPQPVAAGSPIYGFTDEYGAFHIQGTSADAMFALTREGRFPQPRRMNMYHEQLNYYGWYRDPRSGISGYLYEGTIEGGEQRWFLFGDRTLGRDRHGAERRWIVWYDGSGRARYHTQARFYTP